MRVPFARTETEKSWPPSLSGRWRISSKGLDVVVLISEIPGARIQRSSLREYYSVSR